MPLYFVRVSSEHLSFRIPSLLSIAQYFGFPLKLVSKDLDRGVLVVDVEEDEHIERLLDRGTLILFACKLYAHASDYTELRDNLLAVRDRFNDDANRTFKFTLESVNSKLTDARTRKVLTSFDYLAFDGKVDLKMPDVEYIILEDYDFVALHTREARLTRDGNFRRVYFGPLIGYSRARPLISAHNVKTRAYYGNTSMEAEMGFLTAGQALPGPGKLIYDPFVGTGSLLYSCAHWGAYVIGSDIDGRQMRGKQKGKEVVPGILRAAKQYGVADNFLGTFTFDIAQNPLRRGGWLDAIVTDPPYGVRAGAKRIGKTRNRDMREEAHLMPDGRPSHLFVTPLDGTLLPKTHVRLENYRPPTRPYELVNLTLDLIHLARYLLVPGGRLVFFLPTVTEDWDAVDVPAVDGMRELKVGTGSVQEFNKWGRRLITMEKTAQDDGPRPTFEDHDELLQDKLPGHHEFHRRFAAGFQPRESSSASPSA